MAEKIPTGDESTAEWLRADSLEAINGLPDFGFRLQMNHLFTDTCQPFKVPRVQLLPSFVGLAYRYTSAWFSSYWKGQKMFIDSFDLCPWRPIYGAPIGGIGCGTIGRGYRGEFCRFQMVPGIYKYNTVDADQFILCIRKDGQTVYQNVLSPHNPPTKSLHSWKWNFQVDQATYHALYPRSWTIYEIPEWKIRLVCRQISPIFPHDYCDTSLPCAVFVWTVENQGDDTLDVSITFTFQNGQGETAGDDVSGGVSNETFDCDSDIRPSSVSDKNPIVDSSPVSGVLIHQSFRGMECTYAVAARCSPDVRVSRSVAFDPKGSGRELWEDIEADGQLGATHERSQVTRKGEELGCAVCVHTTVAGHRSAQMEFSLSWDMPVIQFGAKENKYRRWYTRFFGADGKASPSLAFYGLNKFRVWEQKIDDWQNPILRCRNLPRWYKSALFNELYFVSDGGTVWVDVNEPVDQDAGSGLPHLPNVILEYGRFAYLEGHEYRMYNTYDVHHYASFALLMLWPKLQLSLQYDIALSIPLEDARRVTYCMNGEYDVVKKANCVPHDVGDPEAEPWSRVNAYFIHPTHEWKDLNSKFVLQVYRDYVVTQDEQYLQDMYPLARTIMMDSLRWDTDGDGIIDNAGFADQTYDAWTVTGASVYCGGMWLAAVKMFCEMSQLLKHDDDLLFFTSILEKGCASFETKLWNGKYYNYDCSSSGHHDSIMADQLAGHWFLRAAKIPEYVFPKNHVDSCLRTVFTHNVLPFDGGRMGAINGVRPDGTKDLTSCQSDEFWTGVTYALAAEMLQEGMIDEAWQTGYGAYHTCYERYGLAFQTPEAYFDDRRYRSLGYMRPLCIWSIQYALENFQRSLLS